MQNPDKMLDEMLNIFLVRFATDMIETLLGEITRILIENPIVSRRTTALLEFQLSSLGMKGCDNPCHPNQPHVRHASSANPTQISAKLILIHAAWPLEEHDVAVVYSARDLDGSGKGQGEGGSSSSGTEQSEQWQWQWQ